MPSGSYSTQPWTCKEYDEEECREQVVQSLTEHYSTVYDCVYIPTAAAGANDGLLVAAYQSGELRLFNWQRVCRTWLATRAQQGHDLSWQAHEGPVYAVALLQSQGFGDLLVTAGDDGYIRIWRLDDIIAAAAAAASGTNPSSSQPALTAAAVVQLPHVQNQLGISAGSQPAAQVLGVDLQQQRLFAAGSDGGVHVIDIARLSEAAAQQQSSLVSGAAAVTSLQGHAAGVLGLDYSAATQQLASASEDGTIRLWDCSSSSSSTPRCISIINPWDDDKPNQGVIPVDQPLELLKCIKSSAITCVRLSNEGRFLVAGNAAGSLVLWNCMDQSVAARRNIRNDEQKCIPQVLQLSPGLVTIAGTDKKLHQFTFQLEHMRSVGVGPDSVFGIAAEPETGMLAVCGSRGCIDLLSEQGAVSGLLRPPASVLVN